MVQPFVRRACKAAAPYGCRGRGALHPTATRRRGKAAGHGRKVIFKRASGRQLWHAVGKRIQLPAFLRLRLRGSDHTASDDLDKANLAGLLSCVCKDGVFPEVGLIMWRTLFPRLNMNRHEIGFVKGCKLDLIRKWLKVLNLSQRGTYKTIYGRLADELEDVGEHCPISRGVRNRILALKDVRMTLAQAQERFFLNQRDLEELAYFPERSRSRGEYHTYLYTELKERARLKYPDWRVYEQLREERARHKAELQVLHEDWERRKTKVVDALVEAGYEGRLAYVVVKQAGHLPYLHCYRHTYLVPTDLEKNHLNKTVEKMTKRIRELLGEL